MAIDDCLTKYCNQNIAQHGFQLCKNQRALKLWQYESELYTQLWKKYLGYDRKVLCMYFKKQIVA